MNQTLKISVGLARNNVNHIIRGNRIIIQGKSLDEMLKDANKIKSEYNKLKSEAKKHPKNNSLQARLEAKEEQLKRVSDAIRNARADKKG